MHLKGNLLLIRKNNIVYFYFIVFHHIQTLKGFRITINKNAASACFFRDSK